MNHEGNMGLAKIGATTSEVVQRGEFGSESGSLEGESLEKYDLTQILDDSHHWLLSREPVAETRSFVALLASQLPRLAGPIR